MLLCLLQATATTARWRPDGKHLALTLTAMTNNSGKDGFSGS